MTQPTTAFVMSAPLLPLSYGQPHLQRANSSRAWAHIVRWREHAFSAPSQRTRPDEARNLCAGIRKNAQMYFFCTAGKFRNARCAC